MSDYYEAYGDDADYLEPADKGITRDREGWSSDEESGALLDEFLDGSGGRRKATDAHMTAWADGRESHVGEDPS